MVRPAPIPSAPVRSCSAPCRLPSPPRQCRHNLPQTPPPPRPDDGRVRRETVLLWKTALEWVQHRSPPQLWYRYSVVNLYFTLSKVDSIISGQVLSVAIWLLQAYSTRLIRCPPAICRATHPRSGMPMTKMMIVKRRLSK